MDSVVVERLVEAVRRAEPRLCADGIKIELIFPDGQESGATSVRLDASSERGLAQLLLWSTGELDLVIGDAVSGEILLDEHREVTASIGIDDAIATVHTYLGFPDPHSPDCGAA